MDPKESWGYEGYSAHSQYNLLTAAMLVIANGQALPAAGLCAESLWVYDPPGKLVCLATADGMLLRSRLAL